MLSFDRMNSSPSGSAAGVSPVDPIDRGRLACWFSYALAFWGPIFAGLYGWKIESPPGAIGICIATGLVLLTSSVLVRSGSAVVAGNYLVCVMFATLLFLAAITGGHGSPPLLWNIAIPIFVTMLTNLRSAAIWTALVIAEYFLFYLLNRAGYEVPMYGTRENMRFLETVGLTGLTLLVLTLGGMFEHYRRLMRDRLQAANEAKSEFLANMSHELRTPLTAILGFSETLGEPGLPAGEHEHALRTIRKNGKHLLQIVNDLLDISQVEANTFNLESRRFSVAELVWEVHDLFRRAAAEKSIQFEVKFCTPVPETIESDPTRLRQILINLVDNAIKFTAKGSVRILVQYHADRFQPLLRFDIVDTGIGVDAGQIDQLFQPFAQVAGGTARQQGGTGLGLTLSKRLTEILGGSISVHSELGRGSQFGVTMPIPFDSSPLVDPSRLVCVTDARDPDDAQPAKSLSGRRILLAEDGPDNQRLITHILRKNGADVTTVADGGQAVDAALRGAADGDPFDVVLMDMQLPELDGHAATRRLRERQYEGPILAVTAHAMPADRDECLAAGCDGVVTKPIDRKTFVETVAAAIATASDAGVSSLKSEGLPQRR